jgi:hypothetical protein
MDVQWLAVVWWVWLFNRECVELDGDHFGAKII